MFTRQVLAEENIVFGLLTITLTLIMVYPFYLYIERRFMSKNYAQMHMKVLAID